MYSTSPIRLGLVFGGQTKLDPNIWPATQVNVVPNVNTAYDKTTDSLVLRGRFNGASSSTTLYSWSKFKTEMLVTPDQLGSTYGVQSFGLSQTGKVLFNAYANSNTTKSLFSLDLVSKKISQITGSGNSYSFYSSGVPFGMSQGFDFDLTKTLAVYKDDSTRTSIFGMTDLFITNLSGGNKIRLNQILPDDSTSTVSSFAIGKQSSRIAYTYTDASISNMNSIGVVNADGSQRKLFTPDRLGITTIYNYLQLINGDQLILFAATSPTEAGTVSYTLSISDGTVRKVRSQIGNTSTGITVSKPTGRYLAYAYSVTQNQTLTEYFIRDTATWKEFSLGALDANAINNLIINEQDQTARTIINQEAVDIDLNTQQKSSPCPNISGMTAVHRLSFSDQSTSYVAKSQSSGDHFIISIYEIKNNQCTLKNSFPSVYAWTSILQVSPANNALLVAAQINERTYISPVHVPLDGKPPIQINSPVLPDAGLSAAYYVNDGHTVVFEGNQNSKTMTDVFAISLDAL